ncbi:hypothetical protein ACHAXR_010903 [Thalassiosira sp. AJA248-18]
MAAVIPSNLSTNGSAMERNFSGDEEDVRTESQTNIARAISNRVSKKDGFILLFDFVLILILILILIIGLSVGLSQRNNKDTRETAAAVVAEGAANPNLKVYDEALALLESTPLQTKQVPSEETLSYREYHVEQSHVLVVVPGFMTDDTLASILAVLPELQDHRIPIFSSTTTLTLIDSHDLIDKLIMLVVIIPDCIVQGVDFTFEIVDLPVQFDDFFL